MLGVHSLAYGLIGGLGTALGPLLGVLIDIGLLESIRALCRLSHDHLRRPGGAAVDRAAARICWTKCWCTASAPCVAPAVATSRGEGGSRDHPVPAGSPGRCPACAFRPPRTRPRCAPRPTSTASRCRRSCNTIVRASLPMRAPTSRSAASTVRVGADMPSMPMAHNVRPVQATAGPEAGTYRARLTLEMHGDWALRIDVTGPRARPRRQGHAVRAGPGVRRRGRPRTLRH